MSTHHSHLWTGDRNATNLRQRSGCGKGPGGASASPASCFASVRPSSPALPEPGRRQLQPRATRFFPCSSCLGRIGLERRRPPTRRGPAASLHASAVAPAPRPHSRIHHFSRTACHDSTGFSRRFRLDKLPHHWAQLPHCGAARGRDTHGANQRVRRRFPHGLGHRLRQRHRRLVRPADPPWGAVQVHRSALHRGRPQERGRRGGSLSISRGAAHFAGGRSTRCELRRRRVCRVRTGTLVRSESVLRPPSCCAEGRWSVLCRCARQQTFLCQGGTPLPEYQAEEMVSPTAWAS